MEGGGCPCQLRRKQGAFWSRGPFPPAGRQAQIAQRKCQALWSPCTRTLKTAHGSDTKARHREALLAAATPPATQPVQNGHPNPSKLAVAHRWAGRTDRHPGCRWPPALVLDASARAPRGPGVQGPGWEGALPQLSKGLQTLLTGEPTPRPQNASPVVMEASESPSASQPMAQRLRKQSTTYSM